MHKQTDQTKPLVTYTPKKIGNKWITDVTSGRNLGIHRQEEFKKAVELLTHCAHNLPNARLFHVCLTGGDRAVYQLVIKRLQKALKEQGVTSRYKAGIENDQTKGLHCHLFIVLSSKDQQTARHITTTDSSKRGGMANDSTLLKAIKHTRTECPALDYSVMMPKHPNCNPSPDGTPPKRVAFLQFNQTNQAFFDNVVEYMSYAYKARSKEGIDDCYLSDKQNKVPTVKQKHLCEIES